MHSTEEHKSKPEAAAAMAYVNTYDLQESEDEDDESVSSACRAFMAVPEQVRLKAVHGWP